MKILIAKLVVLAAVVLTSGALALAYLPMYIFDPEYPMWRLQKDAITSMPDSPAIIVAGDSRAMAGIDPKVVSPDCWSMCLGGATAIEIYYALTTYLKTHTPPKILVLSFAPTHCEIAECFWARCVKFKFISFTEAREVVGKAIELREKALNIDESYDFAHADTTRFMDYKQLALYYLNYLSLYRADIFGSFAAQPWRKNFAVYREMQDNRGHIFFGKASSDSGLAQEVATPHPFTPSRLIDQYFRRVIDLCHRHNIRIVYKIMPYNESSYRAISPAYVAAYLDVLNSLPFSSTDLVDRSVVMYPNTLYGDPSHLNPAGTELFSRKLKAQLEAADSPR